jgi:hypothetical protein
MFQVGGLVILRAVVTSEENSDGDGAPPPSDEWDERSTGQAERGEPEQPRDDDSVEPEQPRDQETGGVHPDGSEEGPEVSDRTQPGQGPPGEQPGNSGNRPQGQPRGGQPRGGRQQRPSQNQPGGRQAPPNQPVQGQPPGNQPPRGQQHQNAPPGQPGGQPPGQPGGQPPTGNSAASPPSPARRIGIILVSLVVLLSVVGATGIYAIQGTALNDQYVSDTMADEGVYGELETGVEDALIDETRGSVGNLQQVVPDADNIVEQTVRDVVTPSYVQQEADRNIEQIFAYLHGSRAPLNLTINTQPVVDGISPAVSEQVQEIPLQDIISQTGIEESFADYPVDFSRVGQAVEDEQTYYEVQADIRQDAQRSGLTSDDINASLRSDLSPPTEVEDSVYATQGTIVQAMTSDMSYEEFQSRLDRARTDFATDAGTYAEQQVRSDVPARIDLDDRIGQEGKQQLDDVAGVVQLLDTLALLLPLLALIGLAILLWLTHSISSTSRIYGITLAIAGAIGALVGFIGGSILMGRAREAVANAEDFLVTTVLALVDGLLGALTTYGVLVLVVGLALVALSVAIRTYEPAQLPRDWL